MAKHGIPAGVDISGDVVTSGDEFNLGALIPQILEKFVAVLEGAAIIMGAFFLIRLVRTKLHKIEATHEQQRNAVNLLEKITSGFIVVISVTVALKIVGIDMTLLVSVAILGLSYGLQDIIKNYVAGILILFKAPFKIGDVVKIRDFTGKVNKMDFQSTTLETFDNRHITIYNSDVMTQSIINFSNSTIRRLNFDVTVGYGSDIQAAMTIFEQILNGSNSVLKNPRYSINFKKFTERGPTFTLRFWVLRPCNILKIKTAIAAQISQTFDEQKIFMPYGKGIETTEETLLGKLSAAHQQRLQTFYSQPMFTHAPTPEAAQAPATSAQTEADSQSIPQPAPPEFDSEEPE